MQKIGMIDYGWRQYQPDMGRWFGADQLAEKYLSYSPYAYVMNNPVMFSDIDGRLHRFKMAEEDVPTEQGYSYRNYWDAVGKGGTLVGGGGSGFGGYGNYDTLGNWPTTTDHEILAPLLNNWANKGYTINGYGNSTLWWWSNPTQKYQAGTGNIIKMYSQSTFSQSYYNFPSSPVMHDGYDAGMQMVQFGEGAASLIGNKGYYLNNEVFRYNPKGAYKWSSWGTKMKNGQSYWNNNFVKNARNNHLGNLKISKLGAGLIAADIVLSGELKPSQAINSGMLVISGTGWGTVIAGAWFIADNGVGLYNYIEGNGFRTWSEVIDDSVGTYEMYEGLY